MIDPDKAAKINRVIGYEEYSMGSLARMTESELRALRSEIDALLPQDDFREMDMAAELVSQLRRVLRLQDDVLQDQETPANQRAQVAGQVASVIQQLTKLQVDFYTPYRFRAIENMVIQFMKKVPLETAQEFLDEYERLGHGG